MIENSSDFAYFIEEWLLNNLGVAEQYTQPIKMVILILALVIVVLVIGKIAQTLIYKFVERVVRKTSTDWDDVLLEQGAFRKLAQIVPAIAVSALAPIIFSDYESWIVFVEKITGLFVAVMVIRVLFAVINAVRVLLTRSEKYKDKPVASFTQLAKILVFSIGAVIFAAILIERNPIYLFSALGAVSAVILLIFKDTILGFIASIQLAINDMVRIGDWVSVEKYGADGNVTAINLTTVMVKNWDNTITTVPTYSFVSDSFKNWRGMEESGGRRIRRSIHVKISTIKFCTAEMVDRFEKISLVSDYVHTKKLEINKMNEERKIDGSSIVNGRRQTNIGILRAYLLAYLRQNENINQDMTCMVRQLNPTEKGVPLEIYCFSKVKAWVSYEEIQADIFDHIFATVPHFDLDIFENPSSADFQGFINQNQKNG